MVPFNENRNSWTSAAQPIHKRRDKSSQKHLTSRGFSLEKDREMGALSLLSLLKGWKFHIAVTALKTIKTYDTLHPEQVLWAFVSFSRAERSSFQLVTPVLQDTPSLSEIKWAKCQRLQGSLLPTARYISNKHHLFLSPHLELDLSPQLQSETLSCLLKKTPCTLTVLPVVPKRTSADLMDKLWLRVIWNLYSLSRGRSWQHFVDTFPQSNVQS